MLGTRSNVSLDFEKANVVAKIDRMATEVIQFQNADGLCDRLFRCRDFSFGLAANRAYCFKCGCGAISARELATDGVKQILGRSLPLFDCLSSHSALHRPNLQHRICSKRQEGRSAAAARILPG